MGRFSLTASVRYLERCVTCWELSEPQVLHGSGGDQWFLGVVQYMSQRVHSHMKVGDVDAHGLFTHSRLVRVPGRLNKAKNRTELKCYDKTECV